MARNDDLASFKLEGAAEIEKALSSLPIALQTKILQAMHREALKTVQKEIIKNAPPDSDIPDAIKIITDKYDVSAAIVGVVSTKKLKAFHARFLEYGTQVRQTKDGASRGKMMPEPFVGKSIDATAPEVIKQVTEDYGALAKKHFDKEFKKAQRANKKLGK
jgi:HK97 gp10 family phage protein